MFHNEHGLVHGGWSPNSCEIMGTMMFMRFESMVAMFLGFRFVFIGFIRGDGRNWASFLWCEKGAIGLAHARKEKAMEKNTVVCVNEINTMTFFFHGVRVYFQLFQTTNLRWLVQVKKHFGMVGSISSQWIIAGQYTYLLPYTTCSTNLISSCHQLVRVNSWGSQGHDFQPRVNISQSIPLYPSITISYCIPIYVGEVMLNPNPIKHISVLFGSGGVLGY